MQQPGTRVPQAFISSLKMDRCNCGCGVHTIVFKTEKELFLFCQSLEPMFNDDPIVGVVDNILLLGKPN